MDGGRVFNLAALTNALHPVFLPVTQAPCSLYPDTKILRALFGGLEGDLAQRQESCTPVALSASLPGSAKLGFCSDAKWVPGLAEMLLGALRQK